MSEKDDIVAPPDAYFEESRPFAMPWIGVAIPVIIGLVMAFMIAACDIAV